VKLATVFVAFSVYLFVGPKPCSGAAQREPLSNTHRIDDELRKLDESEIGKQVKELERRYSESESQLEKSLESYRNDFEKLQKSEAYRRYEETRRKLESERDSQWATERKIMAEAARKLYAARHEELKRLAPDDLPSLARIGLDVLTYPRVDGSTSTHPLSVILACRALGTPYEWIYPEPTGSLWSGRPNLPSDLFLFEPRSFYPSRNKLEFELAASRVVAKPARVGQERVAVMINSLLAANSSTHDAYTNLIAKKCDLNLTARAPSKDELALAKSKGVKLEIQPIARDALVFVVNRANRVTNLTVAQIEAIYRGNLKNWRDVGGEGRIAAVWRERNSGSRELFDALISSTKLIPEPKYRPELYGIGMAGPYNIVTTDKSALGYSVYYYEHFMSLSPYTQTVAINGVEPNAQTIAAKTYPLVTVVYAAFRSGESPDTPAMKLLNWLLSPEGQRVVRESGYVPVKGTAKKG
jgi:phosphate transport system substrate-binding protein